MSYKKGSVVSLIILLILGVLGIYYATQFQTMPNQSLIGGPKFYPIMLCGLLVLFCIIALIDAMLKPDKVIKIPNFKRYFVILGIIVVWVLLWQYVCGFYVSSAIGIAAMLLYLNPEKWGSRKSFPLS